MMKNLLRLCNKKNIWLLFAGIIFSYVLANMLVSPQRNPDRILASGQVFEASNTAINRHDKDWFYDSEQDLHRILSGDAKKRLDKWNEEVDFACMYLELEELNRDTADWFINTYNKAGNFLEQQVITVQNGENWIALNTTIPFQKYEIAIIGAEGMEFRINKICLYENVPQKKRVAAYMGGIFVIFLIINIWIQKKRKTNSSDSKILPWIQEFLEFCYILIGDGKSIKSGKNWTEKRKNLVRTLLFLILFVYMLVMYNLDVYKDVAYYKFHGLMAAVILIVIALVSKEERFKKQKYDYQKLKWWYVFWGIICLSDLLVPKKMHFVGWVMLLAAGFFMFVWKQMEMPEKIVNNMITAVKLLAVAGTLYTMLCRVKYDGLLYNGYMKDAADFGLLSAFMCMLFGVELYHGLKMKEYGKKLLFHIGGLAVSLLQILLSGNIIAMVFAGMLVIWLAYVVLKEFFAVEKQTKWRLLYYGVMGVIVAGLYYLAIKRIPILFNTILQYPNEVYSTTKEPWVIEQLAASGNPVYQTVWYRSIEDTLQIWRAHIREWNIFGHKEFDLRIWNKKCGINSQLLQMIYRYGLMIVIPYIGLLWQPVQQLYRKVRKREQSLNRTEYLTIGMLLFWFVAGSFGSIEYPFLQPAWMIMYVLLGGYTFSVYKNC